MFINEHLAIFILPPLRISDTLNTTAVLVSLRKTFAENKKNKKQKNHWGKNEFKKLNWTEYLPYGSWFIHSFIYSFIQSYIH